MIRLCEIAFLSADKTRAIGIDLVNKEQILKYIRQSRRHKKKFEFIVELILGGMKNTELYDKEDIDDRSKSIRAMKFFKGQENDRLYCKEQRIGGVHCVIIAEVYLKKKTKKNTKSIITIIHKIADYEYEIQKH